MKTYPTVDDIIVIETKGRWRTKSGGELEVLTRIDNECRELLFSYDQNELDLLPKDIRGLRSYRVSNIPKDCVGANEWHKIRNELVVVLEGSALWSCTDTKGKTRDIILEQGISVFTPHHILHTYKSLATDTSLMVLTNTLFYTEIPETHDSYSREEFKKLMSIE